MNPSSTQLPPIPRLRVLHLIAWGAIYFSASSYLLQFPRYILNMGGAAEDAGWLLALGLIPALTLGAWVGDFNRRKGARLPGTVGVALVVASTLAMLMVRELDVWMVAIRMTYAIGHSVVFVTLFTQAAFLSEHPVQRAKIIGWLAIAVQLGNALGGSLGEIAYERGLMHYWLESASIAGLALVLAVTWRGAAISPAATPATQPLIPTPNPKTRVEWPIELWGIAAVGMAFAGLAQFLPAFIEQLRTSHQLSEPFAAAWFITPALIVVALVRFFAGFYAEKLLRPWVLAVCHLFLVITLLLVPWLRSLEQAIVLGLMFGLGYGWLYPALSSLAFTHCTPEDRGKIAGWTVAAFEVGFRLSPVVLGYVISYFGYPAMFMTLVFGYLSLLLVAGVKRYVSQSKEMIYES